MHPTSPKYSHIKFSYLRASSDETAEQLHFLPPPSRRRHVETRVQKGRRYMPTWRPAGVHVAAEQLEFCADPPPPPPPPKVIAA